MNKKSSIVDSLIMPVIKPNFYLEQSSMSYDELRHAEFAFCSSYSGYNL